MSDADEPRRLAGNAQRLKTISQLNKIDPDYRQHLLPESEKGIDFHNEKLANPDFARRVDSVFQVTRRPIEALDDDAPEIQSIENGTVKFNDDDSWSATSCFGDDITDMDSRDQFALMNARDRRRAKDRSKED